MLDVAIVLLILLFSTNSQLSTDTHVNACTLTNL